MDHAALRLFLLGIFLTILSSVRSEEPNAIPAGVAVVDITPDYPVRLSGFGFRRMESEGITQRIHAKALAFGQDTGGPVVLITADILCVPDAITKEIAKRLKDKAGVQLEHLSITSSHTHTAPMLRGTCPTLFGVPIPEDHQAHIDRYTEEFTNNLEKVALAAVKDMRPATVAWTRGRVTFAINRRTPGGPVDHDLPMLAVKDPKGALRAIYFSYACHCVTMASNKISGDWAGKAQEMIEQRHPGCIALASVGCGADSNPNRRADGEAIDAIEDQGRQIAEEIDRLLAAPLTPLSIRPQTKYARVDLPFDTPRSRQDWETMAAKTDASGHYAKVNLAKLDRSETLPASINYPVQTWTFGNQLAMVFMPGETVVDYSLRLKRELDHTRLWVNGYSNDARCYIPSERILREGGYEGGGAMIYYDMPNRFAPGMEQKLIDAVRAQVPDAFVAKPQ
ncbi:MAG TPA: neutral/alkaline non-lysosomal ceramidase N-terminal domain-containing protein [Verrucomicrobiales bacterium]|nr:neutral/alkaline non-lysosomal ceramidase N-terminal domain-containing protein [Verrucomicrobiales bacterium]